MPSLGVRTRWAAAVLLAGVVLLAVTAGLIAHIGGLDGPFTRDPSALNLFGNPTGPSGSHLLGVDTAGRDVLSRTLYGLQAMVAVIFAAAALSTLGALAGVVGDRVGRGSQGGSAAWVARLDVPARVMDGLGAFPPALLGLAVGLGLGPGQWRLVVALALAGLPGAYREAARLRSSAERSRLRELAALLTVRLAPNVALYAALTFLADGRGGSAPDLGQMVAQAGDAIMRGVSCWWALLFPGLVLMLLGVICAGAASTMRTFCGYSEENVRLVSGGAKPGTGSGAGAGRTVHPAVRILTRAGIAAVVVLVLAVVLFRSLFDTTDGIGHAIPASLSLVLGAAIVWVAITAVVMHLPPQIANRLPARGWAAAPVGWVGFLCLYLFSESVGKWPILPGTASYVGLTHDGGGWFKALLLPWLVLGSAQAALMTPTVTALLEAERESGRHKVAAAAGAAASKQPQPSRLPLSGPGGRGHVPGSRPR